VDARADLPVIRADGARLLRMLDNLLENARRHTPAGGTVRLAGAVSGGSVELSVSDTGSGVPESEREAVFERYYRGGDARTRGDGTGLGLAIARAVARAHGGDIEAAASPIGGAAFVVTLVPRPAVA
jgi:signal transduction histidine kinase